MTSTTAPRGAFQLLRAVAYRTFYALPPRVKRRLVRLGVGTYTVGAVVLAREVIPPGGPAGSGGPGGSAGPTGSGGPGGPVAPDTQATTPDTQARPPGAPGSGRLLMVRQPPGKGWSLPAGLLRRRERPVDGAARELAEETGIAVDPTRLSPAVPSAVVHTRGRWIDLVFTAEVAAGTPVHADGQEILEVGWHPVDALPPVTPATARLLAHYGMGPYADYPEITR